MIQSNKGPVLTVLVYEQVPYTSGQHAVHFAFSRDEKVFDMVCNVVSDPNESPYVSEDRALLSRTNYLDGELFDCVQAIECINEAEFIDFIKDFAELGFTAVSGVPKLEVFNLINQIDSAVSEYLTAHPEIKGYAAAYFESRGRFNETVDDDPPFDNEAMPSMDEIQEDLRTGAVLARKIGYDF